MARADVGIIAREADAVESELLALPARSPVLIMERTSYSAGGASI